MEIVEGLAHDRPVRPVRVRRAHGVARHGRGREEISGADRSVDVGGEAIDGAGERNGNGMPALVVRAQRDPRVVVLRARDDTGDAPVVGPARRQSPSQALEVEPVADEVVAKLASRSRVPKNERSRMQATFTASE